MNVCVDPLGQTKICNAAPDLHNVRLCLPLGLNNPPNRAMAHHTVFVCLIRKPPLPRQYCLLVDNWLFANHKHLMYLLVWVCLIKQPAIYTNVQHALMTTQFTNTQHSLPTVQNWKTRLIVIVCSECLQQHPNRSFVGWEEHQTRLHTPWLAGWTQTKSELVSPKGASYLLVVWRNNEVWPFMFGQQCRNHVLVWLKQNWQVWTIGMVWILDVSQGLCNVKVNRWLAGAAAQTYECKHKRLHPKTP